MSDGRRMQIRGIHHVTSICSDMERTIGFYRDVLGLGIVHDGHNPDDPDVRHVWFGALDGSAGMLLSFMEYPNLPRAVEGVGRPHHFALVVDSAEELDAWRDYLTSRGCETTDVYDRGNLRSLYVHDPDRNMVEIATRGPGFAAAVPAAG